jgi:hypothetical protein
MSLTPHVHRFSFDTPTLARLGAKTMTSKNSSLEESRQLTINQKLASTESVPHNNYKALYQVNGSADASVRTTSNASPKHSMAPHNPSLCAMGARSDTLEWDGFGTETSSSVSDCTAASSSSSWGKESGNFPPSSFAESQQSMNGYEVMISPERVDVHVDSSVDAHDHHYAVIDDVRSNAIVGLEDPVVCNNINDDDDYLSIGTC